MGGRVLKPIPALTGVRGVAALWVVLYHMQDAAKLDGRFAPLRGISLLAEGWRGVDLFFVLSGFILFYVHADDFRAPGWAVTKRYAAARFWRVYPLNAVVLVLIFMTAWVAPGFMDPGSFGAAAAVQSFLLAQRWFMPDFGSINGPSWSLSVEILGYASFPLVAWGLNRISMPARRLSVAGLCLAVLVAASYRLGFADANITGRLTILRMFPAFIAGCALAAFFLSGRARAGRHSGALGVGSFVLIIVLCGIPFAPAWTVFPIAGLVLSLAYERGPVSSVMASAPVVWLGRISFSLYLTHFTVLNLVIWVTANDANDGRGGGGPSRWLFLAWVLTIIVAVASLVYYMAERPLSRLSRRFGRVSAGVIGSSAGQAAGPP